MCRKAHRHHQSQLIRVGKAVYDSPADAGDVGAWRSRQPELRWQPHSGSRPPCALGGGVRSVGLENAAYAAVCTPKRPP